MGGEGREGRREGKGEGGEQDETHLATGGGDLHSHAEVEEDRATYAVLDRDHQVARVGIGWEEGGEGGREGGRDDGWEASVVKLAGRRLRWETSRQTDAISSLPPTPSLPTIKESVDEKLVVVRLADPSHEGLAVHTVQRELGRVGDLEPLDVVHRKRALSHQPWREGGREGGREGRKEGGWERTGGSEKAQYNMLQTRFPPFLPSTGCGKMTSSPPRTTRFSRTLSRLDASTRKSNSFSISSAQDLRKAREERKKGRRMGNEGVVR